MAALRRRKLGHRRRVEDEGEDDGAPDALEMDDDSLTDGSLATDDHDADQDSDTSNIDETSPTSPNARKVANGPSKTSSRSAKNKIEADDKAVGDTEMMLHGMAISDQTAPVAEELHFDDVAPAPSKSPSAPLIVSSASVVRQRTETVENRRRQEHEDYRKKRDEDPAFVPNRGAFFMHDHRHAGPAANGFRPFGRGRGRGGRGGGGIGGPFSPMNRLHRPGDPTTSSPWTHDMHETVAETGPRRPRQVVDEEGPANGTGYIPTREPNPNPINRILSTEKHIGNAQVRIFIDGMKEPIIRSGLAVKQYTKLPDHRPPLRRDKPVRISLPNRPPRYIYPASDRSFIFIPRAMRPNQQRVRGKGRSGLGSVGGMSRRTSVFGGSYYGSAYSPSVAMSRRSSFAQERDMMFSPAGSVVSRQAAPVGTARPVVRLPPTARPDAMPGTTPDMAGQSAGPGAPSPSLNSFPQQQAYPPPSKPQFQENRAADLQLHQPRPQKNISVADIEMPALNHGSQPFQQAFHQQVPVHVANGYGKDTHSRHPSFISQHSGGTPLSQIPERAIHAAPFQPHLYGQQPQQPYYNHQNIQPQSQQYFYPQGYSGQNMPGQGPAAGFPTSGAFPQQAQNDQAAIQNLVAQEANGMVYYYDPNQMPQMNSYQTYNAPAPGYQQPGTMGMGGVVTPSPDGYYYPQGAQGMVYY